MSKRMIATGAAVLLAASGWVLASKWDNHRMAACAQRSTHMSTLDLLNRRPAGFQPGSPPSAGCDVDRVVAYADRQFVAVGGPTGDAVSAVASAAHVDEPAVTAFYRQVLSDDAWHIAARPPAPGPNTAALCASKDMPPFGKTYVNLSFPEAGGYEMMVADTADAGANCT